MKEKRNISGMYFRVKNDQGVFEPVCFEDLTEQQQDEILKTKNVEFIKGIAKGMADTLNRISEQFDIVAGEVE
jgi:hypothetical protein